MPSAFENIPHTPQGHFKLSIYAAIFCLVHYLRRLQPSRGRSSEQIFERYPFLAHYYEELRPFLAEHMSWDDSITWWQQEISAWEQKVEAHLPLRSLSNEAGIDFKSRLALMLAGLVEEDSRFGTLFAELQEPLAHRRPCLELVGQVVREAATDADSWTIVRPLFEAGLLEAVNKEAPRAEWVLSVSNLLWDAVKGDVQDQPAQWCRFVPLRELPPIEALIAPKEFLARLKQVPDVITRKEARIIVLRGTPGSDRSPRHVLRYPQAGSRDNRRR